MQRRNFLSTTLVSAAASALTRRVAAQTPYETTPAWEYQRFLDLAEKGTLPAGAQAPAAAQGSGRGPVSPEVRAQRLAPRREDLEVSIQYTKKLLGL